MSVVLETPFNRLGSSWSTDPRQKRYSRQQNNADRGSDGKAASRPSRS